MEFNLINFKLKNIIIFCLFVWLKMSQTISDEEQLQLFSSTFPPPSPIVNINNKVNELVDQIESIDVSSNQIIIITTRQGPPDMARVAIQVVDIESGEVLPHMNLTGILLLLTRGKYTINWLQPNHWYGVYFRAEQRYGGGTAIYANEEFYLLKTKKAEGINGEGGKPIISFRSSRNQENGHSLENLILTIKWEQPKEERQNLDALANITLFCNNQINYRQLKLNGKEENKSLEIYLDNYFEINEEKNKNINNREINVLISPKNCTRICWNVELIAEINLKIFRRAATQNCEELGKINTKTFLRNFVGYEFNNKNNKLIIYTNYSEGVNKGNNELNGYVKITVNEVLQEENEGNEGKNQTSFNKTFSTENNENNFVMEGLEKGKYYAVQYTYGKTSPFVYEESHRFLVNTGSTNEPLIWQFNLTNEKEIKPNVIATAILLFKNYELGVDIEPLCKADDKNLLHFWLDKNQNKKELSELNILDALCTISPKHSICQIPGNAVMIKGCLINNSGNLCWISSIVVNEKLYAGERKCLSLINSIPQLPQTTTIIGGNLKTQSNLILRYYISILYKPQSKKSF
uniref:Uncharacterized protein n=1 Tax=Meloidogyne enterolobii TaxID=390850 RepID=A0A6V7U3G0_MELEN|nr:unnamed protein product [Meloidogyne enterolobii]